MTKPFFSFYEDIFKLLLNLNIENKFGKDSYESKSFSINHINPRSEVYEKPLKSFQFFKNKKFFFEFQNTFYHKHIQKYIEFRKWFNGTNNRMHFYINGVKILTDQDETFAFLSHLHNRACNFYKKRNFYNHSFIYWNNEELISTEEIYSLFLMFFVKIILSDLYLNSVFKSMSFSKKSSKIEISSFKFAYQKFQKIYTRFLSEMNLIISDDKLQKIQDNNNWIEIKIIVN